MSNPSQCAQIIDEKQMLQESLMSQKLLTESYNTYAGECTSEQLRNAFLSILNEEHRIQADIFSIMQTNNWYQVEQAPQQKIQQTRQKLSNQ